MDLGARCDQNADCPRHQYCGRAEHTCQPTGTGAGRAGAGCLNDAGCAPGLLCETDERIIPVCLPICDTDRQCRLSTCQPGDVHPGARVCAPN